MHMTIAHTLSGKDALSRIKKLLTQAKKEFGDKVSDLEEKWTKNAGEFSFKALGFAVSGTLVVSDTDIQIDGTLPWAALPFKGQIEEVIQEKAKEILK